VDLALLAVTLSSARLELDGLELRGLVRTGGAKAAAAHGGAEARRAARAGRPGEAAAALSGGSGGGGWGWRAEAVGAHSSLPGGALLPRGEAGRVRDGGAPSSLPRAGKCVGGERERIFPSPLSSEAFCLSICLSYWRCLRLLQ